MAEDYLDTLDELEYGLIDLVISYPTYVNIRENKLSDMEKEAVSRVDEIIKSGPATDKDLTLYTSYPLPELRKGGKLTEGAYILATSVEPKTAKNVVPIKFDVPKGSPVLNLGENLYLLPRDLSLNLEATETGPVPATMVKGSLQASGFIKLKGDEL